MQDYVPEKSIWTDADFDVMGWHDCRVHALAILGESYELALDLDYILTWVSPVLPAVHFQFWVAPATLVFADVTDLKIELATDFELEIADLLRDAAPDALQSRARWRFEFRQGLISLEAAGYAQYLRRPPILCRSQCLTREQRKGVSFERIGFPASG